MGIHRLSLVLACVCIGPVLLGCTRSAAAEAELLPEAPVSITRQPLSMSTICEDRFVTHALPHTTNAGEATRLFDSNGAGLAINDLDNDDDLDIVLANLKGRHTILWNEGVLTFRREVLRFGRARAVNIVDVDADGWQDIVFTGNTTAPLYLHNKGREADGAIHFEHQPLPGVAAPAYTMNWGDLDGDGDLDLATASYDAALMQEQANTFLFGSGAGVFVYERQSDRFVAQRLAETAQSLALSVVDLNGDQQLDVAVGNDFDMPDAYWTRHDGEWHSIEPFPVTSHSTMSFDYGDLLNDGRIAFFAVDMKPYRYDVAALATWLPLMEKVYRASPKPDDRQRRENVLLVPDHQGTYRNEAYARHLDATGWSWSSKFSDLDNDGFLDLYVVNGMIAEDLLHYLPGGELIEENQVLRNDGRGRFSPMPMWALNSRASGRGMSMADLDSDGDLDIVVNNVNDPAQLFENQLCGGAALEVDLFWPESGNQRALGAQLMLHTSTGRYMRDVRAASGYLSGDPARVHFGIPHDSTLDRLEIRWPDGNVSMIYQPPAASLLAVTR